MPRNAVADVAKLRSQSTFGTWVRRVDELIAGDIAAYRQRCDAESQPGFREVDEAGRPRTKAVKDSLWGMIDLSHAETVVADSPVLQRLRRIRQLGVTYLTYPTAGYSRFEHSLGAMHQSERMLRAIARRSAPELSPTVEGVISLVRLAALLHDVGHLPLSHLSENYYTATECDDHELLAEIDEALAEIATVLDSKPPKLGEALSLAVAATPSMTALLHEVAGYDLDTIAAASLAVVAVPSSLSRAFVPNLISNAIDADKLDYLFRDSTVTRIPLAVDLERLLFKLKVVTVSGDAVPTGLRKLGSYGQSANVLASDFAGHALLFDLLASRSMLFERIYYHHKTRAAERVALDLVRDLAMHPTELLVHDDGVFGRYAVAEGSDAADAARRLETRDLPRRAFAFSWAYLLEQAAPVPGERPVVDPSVTSRFDDLTEDLAQVTSRRELVEDIAAERDRLAALIGADVTGAPMWLEPVPRTHVVSDPDLFVERPDGTVSLLSSWPSKASTYTRNPSATTFLFSAGDQKAVQLAHLAAELVFQTRYGLHFGRSAADDAKVDFEAIENLKRSVEAADASTFDAARTSRPRSAVLARHDGRDALVRLAEKFSTYNVGSARDHNAVVDVQSIRAFLEQFPEALVEPMIAVLDNVDFLYRDDLGPRLAASVDAGTTRGTVIAAPITDKPGKSAVGLPRLFSVHDAPPVAANIREALAAVGGGTAKEICLFDDVTLSGKQAATALQVMMGATPELPREADIATELSETDKQLLQRTPLRLRFVYADPAATSRLSQVAEQLGLRVDVDSVYQTVARGLSAAGSAEADLERFLRAVGSSVLRSTHGPTDDSPWDEQLIEDREFGYGNQGLLVVMFENTPTATVTALWKRGQYLGEKWQPLFPRSHDQPADRSSVAPPA